MVGSRRTTGRSQSAERILDEERAFTRAELVIIIIVIIIIIIRVIMMVMAMVMIIGVNMNLSTRTLIFIQSRGSTPVR